MGVYNAKATTNADGDHVLHVSRTLASLSGFPTPISVRTSADLKVQLEGFTKQALAFHSDAADHGRAAKGRILYVASGAAALSFLTIHVPASPGPIICQDFASAVAASDEQHDLMRTYLLGAAEELSAEVLSRAGKLGNLAWATNKAPVRQELLALGFQSTAKPKGSDCDRTHYLEGTTA